MQILTDCMSINVGDHWGYYVLKISKKHLFIYNDECSVRSTIKLSVLSKFSLVIFF